MGLLKEKKQDKAAKKANAKVDLNNVHLAITTDRNIHMGVFNGNDKTKMVLHKQVNVEFITCMVQRFVGKPEMIKSDEGKMYMIMVQEVKKIEAPQLILPDNKIEVPETGLKKV